MRSTQLTVVLVLLSLVSCGSPTSTPIPTAIATSTPKPIDTPTHTPTNTPVPQTATLIPTTAPTNTPMPTRTATPRATSTPVFQYTRLSEIYNVPALISANDAYNGEFKPECGGPNWGHFDLSPSHLGHGDLTVKAPVGGTISIFDPQGDGRWEGSNITLPKGILIEGIENAFAFSGIPFDPYNVRKINVGLGHIDYSIPYDRNPSTIDGTVTQGQIIGKMAKDPLSKIGWITAYKVYIFYMMDRRQVEFAFSPDLFVHEPWACNPSSPYDCKPQPFDYKPGCK